MNGLIGSNGLIGNYLQQHIQMANTFNSNNINTISEYEFDTVYCSAPSGNRLFVATNPRLDDMAIDQMIDTIIPSKINNFILISTCDTQIRPDTVYGKNRLRLETFVKSNFENYHIIRLSALIDNNITKNILFDIKHRKYIDKINANLKLQWYPLDNLIKDINRVVEYAIKETNLCSEPIKNLELVATLAPDLLDQINYNPIDTHYNLNPYSHVKEDILKLMQEYLNG